jgi:hypothetical protein
MGTGAGSGFGEPLIAAPLPQPVPGIGRGWTEVAAAVARAVPPHEIETIYVFRPIKRDGREWGTAVVTRVSAPLDAAAGAPRLRVYTARYMLIARGKERGRVKAEVEEVALSPAEVLSQVMQATADRNGDPEPPSIVERAAWYEAASPQPPSLAR